MINNANAIPTWEEILNMEHIVRCSGSFSFSNNSASFTITTFPNENIFGTTQGLGVFRWKSSTYGYKYSTPILFDSALSSRYSNNVHCFMPWKTGFEECELVINVSLQTHFSVTLKSLVHDTFNYEMSDMSFIGIYLITETV